jgi:hypothetical protein
MSRGLNLITDHGPFDLAFQPAGTDGYADLARNAITVRVGATTPVIADLADLVRSKSAAGRPKDLPVLELIEEYITTHRPPGGGEDLGSVGPQPTASSSRSQFAWIQAVRRS